MNTYNESQQEFESWDKLAEVWQEQSSDMLDETSGKQRMSDYLEQIRQKERSEIFELLSDIFFGAILVALGVAIAVNFFDFYPVIPNEAFFNSGRNWLTGENEGGDLTLAIYLVTYFSILGFVSLGIFLSLRSYWLRKIYWHKAILSSAHAGEWFVHYFESKIKLCRLSKQIAISLAIIFWIAFVLGRIFIDRPINFTDTNLLIARIGLFIFLPLSIYLVAVWQERKFKKRQTEYWESGNS